MERWLSAYWQIEQRLPLFIRAKAIGTMITKVIIIKVIIIFIIIIKVTAYSPGFA